MVSYLQQLEAQGPLLPYRKVDVSIENKIATVTMSDPDSLNAFGIRLTSELRHAFAALSTNSEVRAIILRGEGSAFSAGGDLRQMSERAFPPAEQYEFIRREFAGVVNSIARCDQPVIAAVEGHAMGVGFFAALSCDMIVASQSAKFGTAYIKLGLTPLGVSYLLAKTLGYAKAYEFCALGRVISAEEMARYGLVNSVTPDGDLGSRAQELAKDLAQGPARALAFTKQILRHAAHARLDEHLLIGEAIQPLCLASDDHEIALAAFAAKQAPKFNGA